MPVIVVTRLRLRDPALLTAFFTAGAAVLRQAKKADGNLGADALGDAKQRGTMNAVTSGDPGAADLLALSRLDDDGAPPAVPRQPKPATGRTEFMTCTDAARQGHHRRPGQLLLLQHGVSACRNRVEPIREVARLC